MAVLLRFIRRTTVEVVQCFPLPQSLSSVRSVCVRERGVAYERPAGTSDVPYEEIVCWHLQLVLRVSLVAPIIVHAESANSFQNLDFQQSDLFNLQPLV